MSKNANKKAKFKPIYFEVAKYRFKKALENQLQHTPYGEDSFLNSILLKIKDNVVTLVSTDGNSLLESKIKLENGVIGEAEIVLSGIHLRKMKIYNAYQFGRKQKMREVDLLGITINEENAEIKDQFNQINYVIPAKTSRDYPKYEQLIPKTNKSGLLQVAFNPVLFSRIAQLTDSKRSPVIMTLNPTNPLGAVVVEKENLEEEVAFKAVFMPMQVRK